MDMRLMDLDSPFFNTLHRIMDLTEDAEKNLNAPTRTYVRDAKAMAATPADVKEYPNSYVFVIDMPGLKSGDIKVQLASFLVNKAMKKPSPCLAGSVRTRHSAER
ncbi:hypothetical protein JHK84_054809 [Glycine max]|nr:hypothetical protein JHK84_054809 [Glycine max]